MKTHWILFKAKRPGVGLEESQRQFARLVPRLTFCPDDLHAVRAHDGWHLFCAASNYELIGQQPPCQIEQDQICVVGGYPTFERYHSERPSNSAEAFRSLLRTRSIDELFTEVGGTWNLAYCRGEELVVTASFDGYSSVFYADTPDYFAVGNKASLVAAVASNSGGPRLNLNSLAWLASTTMVIGDDTAYAGVKKLRPGRCLQWKDGSLTTRQFATNFFTPIDFRDDGERAAFLRHAARRLQDRIAWCSAGGVTLECHLTGGKDTRAILALLLGAQATERLQRVLTVGTEENGDVVVARRIMKAVGLEHKHAIELRNKGNAPLPLEAIVRRFLTCAVRYDGQLTPYDGFGGTVGGKPPAITAMGGGGEIYRQKNFKNHTDLDQAAGQFLNWSGPFDKLGVLTLDVREMCENYLRAECRDLLDRGITNHTAKFYIDHRLSNWGAAHFQNNAGGFLPVLLDFDLCRYVFSVDEVGEDVHFELIRQGSPTLSEIPFLNTAWLGCTREKAERAGLHREPIQIPVEKSFPWQFEFYRSYRNRLIDLVLDHHARLADVISKPGLLALRARPIEPFNSADIKMLSGLALVAEVLLHNPRVLERDFESVAALRIHGNGLTPGDLSPLSQKAAPTDTPEVRRLQSRLENPPKPTGQPETRYVATPA